MTLPVLSDRPYPLLGPVLLRTGLAPLNASGSSKPRRSADRLAQRSESDRPQVHSPRPEVGRLVCPLVEGSSSNVVLLGSPDHVSALSRRTTRVRIRPVIRDDRVKGAIIVSRVPAAFPLPAFASWSSCARRGVPPSSRLAYQPKGWTPTGFPRSARSRCDRGGCPLYPGDGGAHPGWPRSPVRACRIAATRPYTPPQRPIDARLCFTRHQPRVQAISPVRSSPRR